MYMRPYKDSSLCVHCENRHSSRILWNVLTAAWRAIVLRLLPHSSLFFAVVLSFFHPPIRFALRFIFSSFIHSHAVVSASISMLFEFETIAVHRPSMAHRREPGPWAIQIITQKILQGPHRGFRFIDRSDQASSRSAFTFLLDICPFGAPNQSIGKTSRILELPRSWCKTQIGTNRSLFTHKNWFTAGANFFTILFAFRRIAIFTSLNRAIPRLLLCPYHRSCCYNARSLCPPKPRTTLYFPGYR